MYHDLPRTARLWSVLLAIDQDLAETTRKKHVPAAAASIPPTTPASRGALLCNFPSHSASD